MFKLNLAVFATVALMCVSSAWADPITATPAAQAATASPAETATAATTATPAISATKTAQAAPDPNEMICESEAPPTGSLIGSRRICKTRRQWDAEDKSSTVGQEIHHMAMGSGVTQ
jgi:hypothetical protein